MPRAAREAIDLLRQGRMMDTSFDHDLGDNKNATGYDVL
jgi:hypothetical protein